jgi:predicted Zn-ribbon and HTH transcriptional regulator
MNHNINTNAIYSLLRDYNENISSYNNNINYFLRHLTENNNTSRTSRPSLRTTIPIPQTPIVTPSSGSSPTPPPPSNNRTLENLFTRLVDSLNANHNVPENDLTISFSFLRETDEIPIYEILAQRQNTHVTETIYNNQTQIIDYDSTNEQFERICPISHEAFEDGEMITQIRGCGHIFKTQNIKRWFLERSSYCPTCRYDIVSQSHPQTQQPQQQQQQQPPV